jgi:hypothetical protein
MDVIVLFVIITALVFEFTNGFHDTANAMATSIATAAFETESRRGALRSAQPRRRRTYLAYRITSRCPPGRRGHRLQDQPDRRRGNRPPWAAPVAMLCFLGCALMVAHSLYLIIAR